MFPTPVPGIEMTLVILIPTAAVGLIIGKAGQFLKVRLAPHEVEVQWCAAKILFLQFPLLSPPHSTLAIFQERLSVCNLSMIWLPEAVSARYLSQVHRG